MAGPTSDAAAFHARIAELERELQESKREVSEALDQQTAMAEVLEIIASAATDAQPVLDAVIQKAAKLCRADTASFQWVEGETVRVIASDGGNQVGTVSRLVPGRFVTRALLEARTLLFAGPYDEYLKEYPGTLIDRFRDSAAGIVGLCVPLLRQGQVIGGLSLTRLNNAGTRAEPFTEGQVSLVEAFADQAVIAIENARLFRELQDRNLEVTEALERQTATSDVLETISRSPTDLQSVLDAIVRNAVALLGARHGMFYRPGERSYDAVAEAGEAAYTPPGTLESPIPGPPGEGSSQSTAERERRTVHLFGGADAIEVDYPNSAARWRKRGVSASLTVPVLSDEAVLGILLVNKVSPEPYLPAQVELLETFARQAAIAIENARLFNQLQQSNREVTEALDRQTATSDVLETISRSPTDLQSVLDAIVRNAVGLMRPRRGVFLRAGESAYEIVADAGEAASARPGTLESPEPIVALDGSSVAPTAARERRTVHLFGGIDEIEQEYPLVAARWREGGVSSLLAVPVVSDGAVLGVLMVNKASPEPYLPAQIELLETFARQAAIAMENTRLFSELEERNRDVSEALDQQTAMAEVLEIIASSATDAQPVLNAVIQKAARLCRADTASVHWVEGEIVRVVASYGGTPVGTVDPLAPGRLVTEALLDARTVLFAGSSDEYRKEYPGSRIDRFRDAEAGVVALCVPLLRQGQVIAALSLTRLNDSTTRAEPFTDSQVSLVEAFADQAVIAIENARLFNELQGSNRDVREALDRQTATSDVLETISRAPTDLQSVLDTIVRNAASLVGARHGTFHRPCEGGSEMVAEAGEASSIPRRTLLSPGPRLRFDASRANVIAAQERRTVHLFGGADALEQEYPLVAARWRESGVSSLLAVPVVSDGAVLGVLMVNKASPEPYLPAQIELLETFARQATIAIENTNLFNELQERNRELSEALDRQQALQMQVRERGYAFISYASADRGRVEPIVEALLGAGLNIWMDRNDISGGSNWATEIVRAIRSCSALLVACSASAFESRNVQREIQLAGGRDRPFIPLILESADVPDEIAYHLEGWQWVDVMDRPAEVWLPAVIQALAKYDVVPTAEE